MKHSEQIEVSNFINKVQSISSEQANIIGLARELFKKANLDLAEDIKYGGLVFLKSNTLIGGIFPYKEHVSIEFTNGADFSDPQKILEGKGKRRRHLKIHSRQDIDAKNASFFIEQSVDCIA